jgi:plasmid replication initiation protein
MLLQQYRKIGHRSFLVSDLRLAMGVELHEYPEWYEFNRWVIQSAINDLRKADILEVDMTTKKRGRKIHEITFKFYAPGAEKDVTPSAEDQEKGRIITENSARYFTLLKQAQAGKLDFDENEDEEAEDQAYKALLVELKAMQKKAKK